MYSFDGNYRSRRSQVFDRTEKVTASTIVQRTREERKKRELARQQQEAAIKLQAFCRGTLGRWVLDRTFERELCELTDRLVASSSNASEPTGDYVQQLVRLMRLLNWRCRGQVDKEHLLVVCRLLLSKLGRLSTAAWMSRDRSDELHTLARVLRVILRYLASLPPSSASADYSHPVRCLEVVLNPSTTAYLQDQSSVSTTQTNLAWLYLYLARHHYFRLLARFVDNQVPSSAGFLTTTGDPSAPRVFDPTEFARPAQTRAFLDLLLTPVRWSGSTPSPSSNFSLETILALALNDILVSDSLDYTVTERIVRGIGSRLFDTHLFMLALVRMCLSCASDTSSPTLIPSINLLYLLVTVVLPRLLRCNDDVATPASAQVSDEMEVDRVDDSEADQPPPVGELSSVSSTAATASAAGSSAMTSRDTAESVRCIAWLLMRAISVPGLPAPRPLKALRPLVVRSHDEDQADSESDADEQDDREADAPRPSSNAAHSTACPPVAKTARGQAAAYIPTWDTELLEVFVVLRRTLASLASSALPDLGTHFGSDVSPDSLSAEQLDLVRAVAQLHYAISQVYGVPSTSMIRLNSICSRHLLFIRALWFLIQYSHVNAISNSGRSDLSTASYCDYSLFHMLCSGECPVANMTELQTYLPLLFTFVDCLQHRLLCLTDAEICGDDGDDDGRRADGTHFGCGFRADELRQIGARLRDLMLGLIDIAHPDQLPKFNPHMYGTRTVTGDQAAVGAQLKRASHSWSDTVGSDVPSFREVLDRIELRAEAAAAGASPGSFALTRQRSGWSQQDLRLQLHCWSTLFRHVQRLVFQIYDWDRRCHRQSLIQSDMGELCLANSMHPTSTGGASSRVSAAGGAGRLACAGPSGSSQAFWLKESIATAIDSSIKSRLQHGGDWSTLTLAGVPFGYYSRLNPDRDQAGVPFVLSNREVRQVLILKEVPFVIPFERRVRLFQLLVESARASVQGSYIPHMAALATHANAERFPDVSILVRRTHLYEDAFEKLSKENTPNLQPRLRVRFMNQVGAEEAGVDGGGLSREFLSELIMNAFDPTRGFFVYTAEKTLYPNPQASFLADDYLKHYYFLGRMLAKAIYEGMLVEIQFAHFFLAKIASRSGGGVGFDYLHSLDPELYRQLRYLKSYQGNVRDLALDFTVMSSTFGESETVELKPGGRHIPVTEENRVEYMHLMAYYKLNKQIHPQVRAFVAGLNDVICIDWLRLFDADELQTLISGADTVIDVDDLQRHTVYPRDSSDYTETLEHFWTVLRSLSEADKRLFLRFVTACSRPPMFGFRDLQPPFSIQITDEVDRLPTASTCMNLLRLPNFRDPELLRDRLLYALHANAGFEYS